MALIFVTIIDCDWLIIKFYNLSFVKMCKLAIIINQDFPICKLDNLRFFKRYTFVAIIN